MFSGFLHFTGCFLIILVFSVISSFQSKSAHFAPFLRLRDCRAGSNQTSRDIWSTPYRFSYLQSDTLLIPCRKVRPSFGVAGRSAEVMLITFFQQVTQIYFHASQQPKYFFPPHSIVLLQTSFAILQNHPSFLERKTTKKLL